MRCSSAHTHRQEGKKEEFWLCLLDMKVRPGTNISYNVSCRSWDSNFFLSFMWYYLLNRSLAHFRYIINPMMTVRKRLLFRIFYFDCFSLFSYYSRRLLWACFFLFFWSWLLPAACSVTCNHQVTSNGVIAFSTKRKKYVYLTSSQLSNF